MSETMEKFDERLAVLRVKNPRYRPSEDEPESVRRYFEQLYRRLRQRQT